MNNFGDDRTSTGPSEDEKQQDRDNNYAPTVAYTYKGKNTIFNACNNHYNSQHFIIATMTGARIGKPVQNEQQNLCGLASNSLSVQLPFFGAFFPAIESMNKYIKYLKDTKRLTQHINLDVGGWKTFSLEKNNPLYRLTMIAGSNPLKGLFYSTFP